MSWFKDEEIDEEIEEDNYDYVTILDDDDGAIDPDGEDWEE